jgi:hypothetical protein
MDTTGILACVFTRYTATHRVETFKSGDLLRSVGATSDLRFLFRLSFKPNEKPISLAIHIAGETEHLGFADADKTAAIIFSRELPDKPNQITISFPKGNLPLGRSAKEILAIMSAVQASLTGE